MLPALLTTFFFAGTAVFARRSALALGGSVANFWRLLLTAALLGAWAVFFGQGLGAAFGWFFASGLVGFGFGGLLVFYAFPRSGSNLGNLIVQCGSAVWVLFFEWTWLGSRPSADQLVYIVLILAGVTLGLAPRSFPKIPAAQLRLGALLAALSAVGQGTGAVMSRRAFAAAKAAHLNIDPGTASLQRVLAGLLVAVAALAVTRLGRKRHGPSLASRQALQQDRAWLWVVLNTLAGPLLGATCMQWALSTTPAAVVQPIVATAPLLTAPLAWKLGEDLPRRRYFLGALLSVAGTAGLGWDFIARLAAAAGAH